jgi:hypothetical protein
MNMGPITLTVGWIGRHTPPGAGVDGRDAAVIDIAQDLLLRDLHERGSLDALVFKGGTSLRKLYAGNQGRFSLDLDFSVADATSDADTAAVAGHPLLVIPVLSSRGSSAQVRGPNRRCGRGAANPPGLAHSPAVGIPRTRLEASVPPSHTFFATSFGHK